ncbi:MAG: hypothetical protein Q8R26_00530 [bacterium]|nr:hypothetical protein [bacterium]
MTKLLHNRLVVSFTVLIAIALVILMAGLYPVALVNNRPIWRSHLRKSEEAEKRLTNTQAKSLGFKPVNFTSSTNQDLLNGLRQDILTTLIEGKIIEEEGKSVVEKFEELSQKRMMDTLQGGGTDLSKAVRTVYNLSLKDFENMVLLPQARRDVLRVFLANEGKNFEEWLKDIKGKTKIRLFLVPFRWDGERVK